MYVYLFDCLECSTLYVFASAILLSLSIFFLCFFFFVDFLFFFSSLWNLFSFCFLTLGIAPFARRLNRCRSIFAAHCATIEKCPSTVEQNRNEVIDLVVFGSFIRFRSDLFYVFGWSPLLNFSLPFRIAHTFKITDSDNKHRPIDNHMHRQFSNVNLLAMHYMRGFDRAAEFFSSFLFFFQKLPPRGFFFFSIKIRNLIRPFACNTLITF